MRARPLVVSLVTVAVAALVTALLLLSMHHPHDEIGALVAVLALIATVWLALTHLATGRNMAGSLRDQYAAGVLGAVALVLVSVLVGTALMVVSRRDAELVAVMLLFSLIVALRVAGLLSGHAAAQITQLGDGLRRLASAPGEDGELLEFGDVSIDVAARTCVVRGAPAELTAKEFELLLHLARNPGRAFSRDDLMDAVWRYPYYSNTATVTVHVRRLRHKIEEDPLHPRHLVTVWGVGYKLVP